MRYLWLFDFSLSPFAKNVTWSSSWFVFICDLILLFIKWHVKCKFNFIVNSERNLNGALTHNLFFQIQKYRNNALFFSTFHRFVNQTKLARSTLWNWRKVTTRRSTRWMLSSLDRAEMSEVLIRQCVWLSCTSSTSVFISEASSCFISLFLTRFSFVGPCRRTFRVTSRKSFPPSPSRVPAVPHSCVMSSGHWDTWPANASQVSAGACRIFLQPLGQMHLWSSRGWKVSVCDFFHSSDSVKLFSRSQLIVPEKLNILAVPCAKRVYRYHCAVVYFFLVARGLPRIHPISCLVKHNENKSFYKD